MRSIFLITTLFLLVTQAFAAKPKLQNFLFIGGSDPHEVESKLTQKIDGVQIIYSWKSLEKNEDHYTFDKIESDLAYLTSKNKKLWVQLQDRFFSVKDKSVPNYILTEPKYAGGLARQKDNPGEGLPDGQGWVTKQWNKDVQTRFQKLITKLAEKFDGKIYGINLPETSADVDTKLEAKTGFTCDKYFDATVENIKHAKSVFKKSYVVQYSNFWPCEWENDHKYMSRFFEMAVQNQIGLGGPDIVPYKKGQMKNSYPFFKQHHEKLPVVAFAVQEATRTYTNPETHKKFTDKEFLEFAESYLGANVIFWSVE